VYFKFMCVSFSFARDKYTSILYSLSLKEMLRSALVVTALVVMMSFMLPAAYATTWPGPSFVTPASISPGTPINVVLTTGSGSTIIPLPQGSSNFPFPGCTYNSGTNLWTCTFPQQCPPSDTFYYSVHEVEVTDPNGNQYMLGSGATSGLFWPASLGGGGS